MADYHITLSGKPIAAARPRIGRRGVYDPQSKAKRIDRERIREQFADFQPLEGPLQLSIEFFFALPQATPKKYRYIQYHTKKSDIDNLVKHILDSMNGVVFQDDAQASILMAAKYYSPGNPYTSIEIKELQDYE